MWIANCSRVLIRAMISLAIIFVNLVCQLRGHIANCLFWKTCLIIRSMIIINTWHPHTIWQYKHMLRVVRTLLPLDYCSKFAQPERRLPPRRTVWNAVLRETLRLNDVHVATSTLRFETQCIPARASCQTKPSVYGEFTFKYARTDYVIEFIIKFYAQGYNNNLMI